MEALEFKKTYGFEKPTDQREVDMIVMSNLSDLQHELSFNSKEQLNEKINNIKKFILDCR